MTFTENEIFTYCLFGILALIGLVFVIKMKIKQKANRFSQQYKTANSSIKIKKYPIANIFQFRNVFFRVGLICSLSGVVLAFNWPVDPAIFDDDLFVPCIGIYDDYNYQFDYDSPPPIEMKDTFDLDLGEEEEDEIIFITPYSKPIFPKCDKVPTTREQIKCTETQLLQYIYKHIQSPPFTTVDCVPKIVVATFVIDKEGWVKDVTLIRDEACGCGEAAVRVLKTLNNNIGRWTPSYQRRKPVKMKYNVLIHCKLK